MAEMIKSNAYLSNTPLEVAYRWILACKSFKERNLVFYEENGVYKFCCEDVVQGRIFDGHKPIQITDSLIEKRVGKNTLYHVQEGKRFRTHPLFDLFFICKLAKKDTLVMIDVTGGDIGAAENKLSKLS